MNALEVTLGGMSFSVAQGDLFALLGAGNDAKLSLFNTLSTLVAPASGTVEVFGADVVKCPREARRAIGVMFRSPAVDPYLTVLENLRHHGYLYGMSAHDVARGAERSLERLGLMPLAANRVATLSTRQRRRVELAKVLVPEPRLIVLDEPGTGLNPRERREFLQDLRQLRDDAGTTIVFTTDAADEAALATRVGILDGGHLSAIGKTHDLSDAIRRFATA